MVKKSSDDGRCWNFCVEKTNAKESIPLVTDACAFLLFPVPSQWSLVYLHQCDFNDNNEEKTDFLWTVTYET